MLVDAKGKITVKTDPVRQALDYYKKLMAVPAARRAGLGRRLQQQVAGLRQGRADHEPAERLGGRQARRAAGRRAAAGRTACRPGPKGRFAPFLPYFWGIWNFSKNKSAAKSLLVHLSQPVVGREDGGGQRRLRPAVVREADDASRPGPRKGRRRARSTTIPTRYNHQILSIAGGAGAAQDRRSRSTRRAIMTKMTVRHLQGEPMEKTLAWAESEVEGFMRT